MDLTCFLLIVENPFLEFAAVAAVVGVVVVAGVGVAFGCIDLMHFVDRTVLVVDDTLIEGQFAHLVLHPNYKEGKLYTNK